MEHQEKVQNYYKLQAPIYDLTRWAFLFGRRRLPEWIREVTEPHRILEIGCGTGANLSLLAKAFPNAELTGVDISESMLHKAHLRLRRDVGGRVKLLKAPFETRLFHESERFDLIVCSYALSMMGQIRSQCIQDAGKCLKPGGHFMVLDFLETPFCWFRKWMGINHVQLDPKLLMECVSEHVPLIFQKHKAYFGLWTYFMFIGNPVCHEKPTKPSHNHSMQHSKLIS